MGVDCVLSHVGEFIAVGAVSELQVFFAREIRNERVRRSLTAQLDEQLGLYTAMVGGEANDSALLTDQLASWRETLASNDLATQIKDLTARDYWSVARSARRIRPDDNPDRFYEELATEAVRHLDVLSDLADWLSSPEAKSSGALGFALGRADTELTSAPLVSSWLREARCQAFVTRYVFALGVLHCGMPEVWSQRLDEAARSHPLYVVLVSLEADPSRRGFRRIMSLLPVLPSTTSGIMIRFAYGLWSDVLDDDDKAELIALLQGRAQSGDTEACRVAFNLVTFWSNQGVAPSDSARENSLLRSNSWNLRPVPPSLLGPIAQMATLALDRGDKVADHDFENAMRLLANDRPEQAAHLLVRSLTTISSHSINQRERSLQVLRDLARTQPVAVMDALGRAILDPQRRVIFGLSVFRGLFESIGLETVQAWVREHGEETAVWIARHLQSPGVDDEGQPFVPPLTQWLLTEFEHSNRVFSEFCAGRHSFEVHWGDVSDRSRNVEESIRPFRDHPISRMRDWARYELESHHSDIEYHRRSDDRFERR